MYHYTKTEAFKSIIKEKKFWISSSLDMNDQFDRVHALKCVKQMVFDENCVYFAELRKNVSNEDIDRLFEINFSIPFYSVSFCEEDNDYLWKNYSDNNTGERLRFDKKSLDDYLESLNKKFNGDCQHGFDLLNFRNIEYGNGEEYIKSVGDTLKKSECYSNKKFWLEMIIYIVSGTIKCKRFSEEKEYRLLFKNIYSDNFLSSISLSSATFLEFQKSKNEHIIKEIGLDNLITNGKKHYNLDIEELLKKDFLTQVMIGKNSDVSVEQIKQLLLDNGLNGTEVLKQY